MHQGILLEHPAEALMAKNILLRKRVDVSLESVTYKRTKVS